MNVHAHASVCVYGVSDFKTTLVGASLQWPQQFSLILAKTDYYSKFVFEPRMLINDII